MLTVGLANLMTNSFTLSQRVYKESDLIIIERGEAEKRLEQTVPTDISWKSIINSLFELL